MTIVIWLISCAIVAGIGTGVLYIKKQEYLLGHYSESRVVTVFSNYFNKIEYILDKDNRVDSKCLKKSKSLPLILEDMSQCELAINSLSNKLYIMSDPNIINLSNSYINDKFTITINAKNENKDYLTILLYYREGYTRFTANKKKFKRGIEYSSNRHFTKNKKIQTQLSKKSRFSVRYMFGKSNKVPFIRLRYHYFKNNMWILDEKFSYVELEKDNITA